MGRSDFCAGLKTCALALAAIMIAADKSKLFFIIKRVLLLIKKIIKTPLAGVPWQEPRTSGKSYV
jgi:hypothetical protein